LHGFKYLIILTRIGNIIPDFEAPDTMLTLLYRPYLDRYYWYSWYCQYW